VLTIGTGTFLKPLHDRLSVIIRTIVSDVLPSWTTRHENDCRVVIYNQIRYLIQKSIHTSKLHLFDQTQLISNLIPYWCEHLASVTVRQPKIQENILASVIDEFFIGLANDSLQWWIIMLWDLLTQVVSSQLACLKRLDNILNTLYRHLLYFIRVEKL